MMTKVSAPLQFVAGRTSLNSAKRLRVGPPAAASSLRVDVHRGALASDGPGFDLGKIAILRKNSEQALSDAEFGAGNARGIHQTAERGFAGSAQTLPHLDRIQRSFGCHDIGSVQAHVGGAAAEAARGLGASAYTVGNSVAFRDAPELHTAAHEAAHVVQQRHGVHLADGLGQEGDRYERHADAVADAVIAGRSAQPLLDGITGSVQRNPSAALQRQDDESLPPEEAAAVPEAAGERPEETAVQRKAYKGRGGIGIMAPATMPYFYEMGDSTTEDVEATVSWEPKGIPKISVESRDLKIGTTSPGDVVSLTPVYMESQFYGRPYPSKQK
jgi:hypothetical protein